MNIEVYLRNSEARKCFEDFFWASELSEETAKNI